ncbi:hypothetical protein [Methanobrevibacter sp.]|jgi:hypothetical protein|uniref:hypothetical protein n=1 Tax=Methanobrevibacter sp. TaxID=66852 RepID=UPI00387059B3
MISRIQCQYCRYSKEKEYRKTMDNFITVTYTDGYYCIRCENDVEPTSSCDKFKRRIILEI